MKISQSPAALTLRLGLFAGVWVVIAGTDPASWLIGISAVIAASLASWRLRPEGAGQPHLGPALAFIPFFFWSSLKGGVDVAWRVLQPQMRIAPGLHPYRLRLINPSERVLLLASISLLPGTLSADLEGDTLILHALDASDPNALEFEIAHLERRIGSLFGEPWAKTPD
ncbi:Na+/H+ antiporter subunit E [Caldichromatium japonicum]|uniref:Na+/H+ antiporter subunit E n=1 Tax=Caldichromatium japonicum TaxID=2699430 RepID=A0A6G7VBR8_9GAMM|nr:Na+/H+ antiporter subunit E [Caldichromatium japonicum]QIK37350.1 Na+/H+ antiporter subunit E [Caldichromatium japonicum]